MVELLLEKGANPNVPNVCISISSDASLPTLGLFDFEQTYSFDLFTMD